MDVESQWMDPEAGGIASVSNQFLMKYKQFWMGR